MSNDNGKEPPHSEAAPAAGTHDAQPREPIPELPPPQPEPRPHDATRGQSGTSRRALLVELSKSNQWKDRLWWIPNALQLCVLVVILFQYDGLTTQLNLTKGQLAAMEQQLALTNSQVELTQKTTALGILRQLRDDTREVTKNFYSSDIYERLRRIPCDIPLGNVEPTDALVFKQLHEHYELYFDAAKLGLISRPMWESMCRAAQEVRRCHVKSVWDQFLEKSDPAFKDAFSTCELPTSGRGP